MASLFTLLEAWKTTARLLEQFGEAYILWKVQKIKSDHRAVSEARNELIIQINLARAQRDSAKLINLNRALYLVEYGAGVQHSENKSSKG